MHQAAKLNATRSAPRARTASSCKVPKELTEYIWLMLLLLIPSREHLFTRAESEKSWS